MTEKYQPGIKLDSGQCLTDDQLNNYLCKKLSSKEAQLVEEHLNNCNTCFQNLVMILKVAYSPTTQSERNELKNIKPLTIDDQVSKILTYDRELNPERVKNPLLNRLITFSDNLIRKIFLTTVPRWRSALAYSFLAILIVGILGGYPRLYQMYHFSQAKSLLEQNYQIDIENDMQFAGQFAPGMGKLMATSDNENRESYLTSVEMHLRKILNVTPDHADANTLLAKVYIIERKFAQAESLYNRLPGHLKNSAPLLNDLAIFLVEKGDTSRAISLFKSAIKVNAQLPEPYYNLGKLLNKINSDSGSNFITRYLEVEKDTRWKDVVSTE